MAKFLIVYGTKHGQSKKIAETIGILKWCEEHPDSIRPMTEGMKQCFQHK